MNKFYIVSIVLLLFGCKTNLGKIDIDNIEENRAYQDSLFVKAKNVNEILSVSKKLIQEYQNLSDDGKEDNPKYNYYLARIYSRFQSASFWGQVFDTVSHKLVIDSTEMIHFIDSTYYFSENSLRLDSNQIRSMFILALTISYEEFNLARSEKKHLYSLYRDSIANIRRLNYLVNNAERFIKEDASDEMKYISRGISEVALYILASNLDGYKFDKKRPIADNANQLALRFGNLYNYIHKFKDNVLVNIDRDYYDKIMLQYNLLVNEINHQNENQKIKDIIKEREGQTIKATELTALYEENEVNADENYKGRTFYVEGIVEDIKKDIMDQIYVSLEGDQMLSAVQCFLDGKSTAINLRKGMRVTFQGKCDGLMFSVLMKNCVLVENLSDLKKKVK